MLPRCSLTARGFEPCSGTGAGFWSFLPFLFYLTRITILWCVWRIALRTHPPKRLRRAGSPFPSFSFFSRSIYLSAPAHTLPPGLLARSPCSFFLSPSNRWRFFSPPFFPGFINFFNPLSRSCWRLSRTARRGKRWPSPLFFPFLPFSIK